MKTNIIKQSGRIIYLGNLNHFQANGSEDKIASIHGLIAIPQPVPTNKNGEYIYENDVWDFECTGRQAEYLDKYFRSYHSNNNEGVQKFKARSIIFTGFYRKYLAKISNKEKIIAEIDSENTIEIEPNQVKMDCEKVSIRILIIDALDFEEKREEKVNSNPISSVKVKIVQKTSENNDAKIKTRNKKKSAKKVVSDQDNIPECIIEDGNQDETPF